MASQILGDPVGYRRIVLSGLLPNLQTMNHRLCDLIENVARSRGLEIPEPLYAYLRGAHSLLQDLRSRETSAQSADDQENAHISPGFSNGGARQSNPENATNPPPVDNNDTQVGTSSSVRQNDSDEIVQNSEDFRVLMRSMPQPICLITVCADYEQEGTLWRHDTTALRPFYRGLTVSSFNAVAIGEKTFVSFNIRIPSRTLSAIDFRGSFCAHVLASNRQGAAIADTFAKSYENPVEPFNTLEQSPHVKIENYDPDHPAYSAPLIIGQGVLAHLWCKVDTSKRLEVGDHVILVATAVLRDKLQWGEARDSRMTLCYAQRKYRRLTGGIITPAVTMESKPRVTDQPARHTSDHAGFDAESPVAMNYFAAADSATEEALEVEDGVEEDPAVTKAGRFPGATDVLVGSPQPEWLGFWVPNAEPNPGGFPDLSGDSGEVTVKEPQPWGLGTASRPGTFSQLNRQRQPSPSSKPPSGHQSRHGASQASVRGFSSQSSAPYSTASPTMPEKTKSKPVPSPPSLVRAVFSSQPNRSSASKTDNQSLEPIVGHRQSQSTSTVRHYKPRAPGSTSHPRYDLQKLEAQGWLKRRLKDAAVASSVDLGDSKALVSRVWKEARAQHEPASWRPKGHNTFRPLRSQTSESGKAVELESQNLAAETMQTSFTTRVLPKSEPSSHLTSEVSKEKDS
ncbi:hypothetical protein LTR50_007313 [Elasticomyces elasticus]|nr:hypothetical protein LTR50_007313 [Elasticomyces elasticus]